MDTIEIVTSEEIRTRRIWSTVLVWSKSVNGKCEDYKNALPVQSYGAAQGRIRCRKITIIVPTGTGVPTPLAGDCVYLNTNGIYTDMHLNIPPEHGVILKGTPAAPGDRTVPRLSSRGGHHRRQPRVPGRQQRPPQGRQPGLFHQDPGRQIRSPMDPAGGIHPE